MSLQFIRLHLERFIFALFISFVVVVVFMSWVNALAVWVVNSCVLWITLVNTLPPCPTSDELWSVYLLCCNELFTFSIFSFTVSIGSLQTEKFMPPQSLCYACLYICSSLFSRKLGLICLGNKTCCVLITTMFNMHYLAYSCCGAKSLEHRHLCIER